MKNFRLFLGIASCSLVVAGSIVACGGDDTTIPSGSDSGAADATTDTRPRDDGSPMNDVSPMGDGSVDEDSGPADGGVDAAVVDSGIDGATDSGPDTGDAAVVDSGPPPTAQQFLSQVASQVCTRIAACCTQIDGGTVDNAKCVTGLIPYGWQGSSIDLNKLIAAAGDGGADGGPVLANLTIDSTGAQACLNAIMGVPCGISSAVDKTVMQACNIDAVHGKMTTGQACEYSVECQQPAYCSHVGDGGTGTCQPLVAQGGDCSNVGGTGYTRASHGHEACSRRATGLPALYCDNLAGDFSIKPVAQWSCQAAKSNGSSCVFNATCTSQICDSVSTLCMDTLNIANPAVCQQFK